MKLEEFAAWCAYFRQQLMRAADDSEFLDDWRKDLEAFALNDAKDAVMHCVRTATQYDKPKQLLSKILTFLNERRLRRTGSKLPARIALCDQVERGEAWERSPQRKKFLSLFAKKKARTP